MTAGAGPEAARDRAAGGPARKRAAAAKWLYLLAAALLLAYLAWPYAALYRLYAALRAGDQEAVAEAVDWSSVRENLRADLDRVVRARLHAGVGEAVRAGGVAATVTLSWTALPAIDYLVDTFVTAEGLIWLFDDPQALRCALPAATAGEAARPADCKDPAGAARKERRDFEGPNLGRWRQKVSYAFFIDPFTFELDVRHAEAPVVVILERQGWGWRLTRLGLPVETASPRR